MCGGNRALKKNVNEIYNPDRHRNGIDVTVLLVSATTKKKNRVKYPDRMKQRKN